MHGKELLHACLVVPAGQVYHTGLGTMLSIFGDSVHKPRPLQRAPTRNMHGGPTNPASPFQTRPGLNDIQDAWAFLMQALQLELPSLFVGTGAPGISCRDSRACCGTLAWQRPLGLSSWCAPSLTQCYLLAPTGFKANIEALLKAGGTTGAGPRISTNSSGACT